MGRRGEGNMKHEKQTQPKKNKQHDKKILRPEHERNNTENKRATAT